MEYWEDVSIVFDFGSMDAMRLINANACYEYVGEIIAFIALPFLCFITSFFRKSKINLFNSWMSSPNFDKITDVFKVLSWHPFNNRINDSLRILEAFIAEVYGCQNGELNILRWRIFKSFIQQQLLGTSSN